MQLHITNLINEENGRTNTAVLKAMSRRRALADYGELSPRALRSSLRYYSNIRDQLYDAWRMRHGLPVEIVLISPYGKQRDGIRRSAF
jgi:hypothetical protein